MKIYNIVLNSLYSGNPKRVILQTVKTQIYFILSSEIDAYLKQIKVVFSLLIDTPLFSFILFVIRPEAWLNR